MSGDSILSNQASRITNNDYANFAKPTPIEVTVTTSWVETEMTATVAKLEIDNQTAANNNVQIKFRDADTEFFTVYVGDTLALDPFRGSSIFMRTLAGTATIYLLQYLKGTQ
jgi:hypothetical protein